MYVFLESGSQVLLFLNWRLGALGRGGLRPDFNELKRQLHSWVGTHMLAAVNLTSNR